MSQLTDDELLEYNNLPAIPPNRPLGDVLQGDLINKLLSYHVNVATPGRLRSVGGTAPTVQNNGPLLYLAFAVGTDEAFRSFKIDSRYVQNAAIHMHWTKSQDTDQSGNIVKWQVEYSVYNGSSENAAVVEHTVSVEDEYEDNGASASDRIVYRTPNIPLVGITAGYYVSMRITAQAPTGSPAIIAPGLVTLDMTWEGYGNKNSGD